jgi:hypothetical protein
MNEGKGFEELLVFLDLEDSCFVLDQNRLQSTDFSITWVV